MDPEGSLPYSGKVTGLCPQPANAVHAFTICFAQIDFKIMFPYPPKSSKTPLLFGYVNQNFVRDLSHSLYMFNSTYPSNAWWPIPVAIRSKA
jgi:hypothetical protein